MSDRTEDTDVLVIGGGTAGFGAAVAAGRLGFKVTLVEGSNKVGGVMAHCPGMPWGGAYPADQIIGGLIEELTNRLQSLTPPAAEKRPCTLENFGPEIVYDHDLATLTMFEMLEEAGVKVRLNTIALEPRVKARKIQSIRCSDKRGEFLIKPKIVIDCSGDGDISAKAGVPYSLGDEKGNMMAVTMSFHLFGVDWQKAFEGQDPYFREYAVKGVAQGRLHADLTKIYLMRAFYEGTVFCNSVHIRDVDGTDPAAVSRATQEGRRRCYQLAQFLRQEVPGFEDAYMTHLSPSVGVRETRKLKGVYRLKGADLAKGTKFFDGIVSCDNPIDDVMRSDAEMTHDAALAKGDYYTIPFRTLVPEFVENLLFAGRILSADSIAFASVRGMPQCIAMGQATGTAAAIALREGRAVQKIDANQLISALEHQGINRLRNGTRS